MNASSLLGLIAACGPVAPSVSGGATADAAVCDGAELVMLWGQSNAGGQGGLSGLPAEYSDPDPTARMWHDVPGSAVPRYTEWGELYAVPDSVGVELVIGRTGAWIEKYAASGTAFEAGWLPGQFHLAQALADARDGIAAGPAFSQTTLVWIHGESDAASATWAGLYQSRLETLIDDTKAAHPGMRTVICRLHVDSQHAYRATVRAAMDAIAAARSDVVIVDTDALTLFDGIHYSTPSQMRLGEAIVSAMASWVDTSAAAE